MPPRTKKPRDPNAKHANRDWRAGHDLQYAARAEVARMLKSGQLVKLGICSKCKQARPTEFHHPDYSKPREVVELCRECHVEVHRLERVEAKRVQQASLQPRLWAD